MAPHSVVGGLLLLEEAQMAKVKKTGTRLVHWFKEFAKNNRPPQRWNEYDWYGS